MTSKDLRSTDYDFNSTAEAIEFYYKQGWTDGLPIMPPTEDRIRAMLDAGGLDPDDQITFIEHRQVSVTAGKVAINAVMAGCKPNYMPVITAALEAIGDPRWSYHGASSGTGGAAVFMLINGPIARELDINCDGNLFGPGWRANATIGRTVHLVMRNVIGTIPGRLDRSTLGHGGKYTFCIAENEEESPWPALHVERGFQPEQNAVTVFAALAPQQFYNSLSNTAEGVLTTACAHMRISIGVGFQPQYIIVLAGEHMKVIGKDGWSKEDIRRFCFKHTQSSVAELKRINLIAGTVQPEDETALRPLVPTPEDLIVVAAGGQAGGFSCYIPGWGSKTISQSITKEIHWP